MSEARDVRKHSRTPLWKPGPSTREVSIDRLGVERLVEHRSPFLLLDSIVAVDLAQQSVRATRSISPTDWGFSGHFPRMPVYPGVLQIEMAAQAALCAIRLCQADTTDPAQVPSPVDARASKIHGALFVQAVRPGDELTLLATVAEGDELSCSVLGQVISSAGVCSVVSMEVYLVH